MSHIWLKIGSDSTQTKPKLSSYLAQIVVNFGSDLTQINTLVFGSYLTRIWFRFYSNEASIWFKLGSNLSQFKMKNEKI